MPDDTAPALGFSIVATLNNKRQITVQSFVPLDTSKEEIAKTLDKILDQLDRQDTRYRLHDLKILLERDEKSLAQHISQAADLQNAYVAEHAASGRRGEYEPKGTQKTNIENVRKTIEALKEQVAKIKVEIKEGESLVKV